MNILDYVHLKGYLHCDIKPDNILWLEDDTIQLIDFGSASIIQQTASINQLSTTFEYAAPEIVEKKRIPSDSTAKIDMWSFGATMLHVTTGAFLIDRNCSRSEEQSFVTGNGWSLESILTNHFEIFPESRVAWEGLPEQLRRIISLLLSHQPDLRPSTGDLIVNENVNILRLII